jgi:hypothetical protein
MNNFLKYLLYLIFIFIVGFFYFQMKTEDQNSNSVDLTPDPSQNDSSQEETVPRYPIPDIEKNNVEQSNLISLPPLGESDEYLRLELSDLIADELFSLVTKSNLVEKIVATIDNLPRDYLAERMRPINIESEKFVVEAQGVLDGFILSEENYERYNTLIDALEVIDKGVLAEIYLRFYPLFQEAYQDLGYPDIYFNDRLIDVIDHLLETPEVNDPIILHTPNNLYEYVHPEIESLSSGQKLLIRMGKRHTARVKQFLRELRALIS